MNYVLTGYEPKDVLHYFEELSAIPRGTFDMQRISDFVVSFAKERGLEYIKDEALNVVIKKKGSAGYEAAEPVAIQGHMDMVCEAAPGVNHDFTKDGLDLYIEDGCIRARGTTLGADNGIACAMMMAVLADDSIPHPPLECIFTTDEEQGMVGAGKLDVSVIKAKKMINADSDEEGIITVGCCGGYRYEAYIPVTRESAEGTKMSIKLSGFLGGHSGLEINKQRGNAHKQLGRILYKLCKDVDYKLVSIGGGSKDNVIAKDSEAIIIVKAEDAAKVSEVVSYMGDILKREFSKDEPDFKLETTVMDEGSVKALDEDSKKRVLRYIEIVPNGVQTYSREIAGAVETSLNMGIIETTEGEIKVVSLVRSSFESKKKALMMRLDACADTANARINVRGEYPCWEIKPNSELRDIMVEEFTKLYGREPEVVAVHAGLEPGLFLSKNPEFDAVSFGPALIDIHSFNERADIASVERSYKLLLMILARCK